MRTLKFLIAFTIGVIRDTRIRRQVMFYGVLVALVLLFAGSTFLEPALRRSVWVFAGYWFICAWLTVAALLLALYDMLAIGADARRERRRLKKEILKAKDEDAPGI